METSKRVAIYARCSTDEQRDSPEVQLEACREYAAREKLHVVAEYVDAGVSGGLPLDARPDAGRMLQDARDGRFDAVLALRLDRLGRDQIDLLLFRREADKLRLRLLFVTQTFGDDPTGEFVYSLLGAVGQLERRMTGQRIYEHALYLAKQGRKPCGSAPLGLTYDPQTKKITASERAGDAVAVFQAYVDTGGSKTRTAAILNAAGIKTSRGNLWSDRGVHLAISNTLYRQVIKYDGMEFPAADVPQVVPRELVDQAQSMISVLRGSRPPSTSQNPYVSILRCRICGQRYGSFVAPASAYRPAGTRRFRCPGNQLNRGCPARTFGEARIIRCIVPILVDLLKSHVAELAAPPAPAPRVNTNTQEARERLIDLHTSGIITKAELKTRLDKLADTPRRITQDHPVASAEEIAGYLGILEERWEQWPPQDKRALLLAIAPRIDISWVGQSFDLTLYSPLADEPICRHYTTERSHNHRHHPDTGV